MKILRNTKDNYTKVDVKYKQKFHEIHNDLPFLPEKMKIGKFEKLTYNLNDKEEYVVHYKSFKTSTKSWISI